jgi:hypothetical protein
MSADVGIGSVYAAALSVYIAVDRDENVVLFDENVA